jgi:hypothetical protein
MNFLHPGKEKTALCGRSTVFKIIYYFSCCQLTSVMHYIKLKAEKKELKKLRRANESNRPTKIQTSNPVSDVAYSLQSVVEAKSRKVTQHMKTVH